MLRFQLNLVEMNSTAPPDLLKQLRNQNSTNQEEKTTTNNFRKHIFSTKMNIARNHEVNQIPELVEMNSTSLPDLPKQPRTSKTLRKQTKLETEHFRKPIKSVYLTLLVPMRSDLDETWWKLIAPLPRTC